MQLGWELLALNLALEEWRHWLEGVDLPFVVRTDHKNLYTHRQKVECPALVFNRFHFTLSYCSGSKNVKPDALSQQFLKKENLSPSCVVEALIWEIEG